MNNYKWTPLALALAMSASLSHATTDVDIDNDGLIEISTLQELDLMRYDLAGTSLNGDSTGCPATGCNGYELVADLDFDTNGNGVADAGDLFWNGGEGWEPMGDTTNWAYAQSKVTGAFTGNFDGNSYSIANLYIDRPNENWVGLWANTNGNKLENLIIRNSEVSGANAAGILSGGVHSTEISHVRIESSSVSGEKEVGLLTGRAIGDAESFISHVTVEGQVYGTHYAAGVIGWLEGNAVGGSYSMQLSNVISDVSVSSGDYSGCISGVARGVTASNIIIRCPNVEGLNYVGGVFGSLQYGFISDIFSSANVDGSNYVGGIIGTMNQSSIDRAFVGGEAVTTGGMVGGLVGQMVDASISNSAAHGLVEGKGAIASGVVNKVRYDVSITNVYSASPLTTNPAYTPVKSGLIAEIYYSATNVNVMDSYWDTDVTGATSSAGGYGSGQLSADLKCPVVSSDPNCVVSLYFDWDEAIWDFGTSSDYPVLR